jgi:hypothetical protein
VIQAPQGPADVNASWQLPTLNGKQVKTANHYRRNQYVACEYIMKSSNLHSAAADDLVAGHLSSRACQDNPHSTCLHASIPILYALPLPPRLACSSRHPPALYINCILPSPPIHLHETSTPLSSPWHPPLSLESNAHLLDHRLCTATAVHLPHTHRHSSSCTLLEGFLTHAMTGSVSKCVGCGSIEIRHASHRTMTPHLAKPPVLHYVCTLTLHSAAYDCACSQSGAHSLTSAIASAQQQTALHASAVCDSPRNATACP